MSNVLEIDSAHQFAGGRIANAAKLHVQIGALQNSGIPGLSPGNTSKDDGKDGNNERGNRGNIVAVGPDKVSKKRVPVTQNDLTHGRPCSRVPWALPLMSRLCRGETGMQDLPAAFREATAAKRSVTFSDESAVVSRYLRCVFKFTVTKKP